MRSVKYANLAEKKHCYSTTFAFTEFRSKFDKQCFNILPSNIAAHGPGEDSLKGFLVLPFHPRIVPYLGTM